MVAMWTKRDAFTYCCLVITVMILGLSTRHFSFYFPSWINLYLGDALWALMVFFLWGLLFRTRQTSWITLRALLFTFSIEVSQLYQSQWINSLRTTRLGGLILGYGFLWSDLIAYSIGIGVGVLFERVMLSHAKRR